MTNMVFCRACGTVGTPIKRTKGSLAIEIVAWLLFLIPGVIYSLWRLTSKQRVCRACGSADIIPADAPAAVATLVASGRPAAVQEAISVAVEARRDAITGWAAIGGVIGLGLAAYAPGFFALAMPLVGWALWILVPGRMVARISIALVGAIMLPIAAGLVGSLLR
jgi:hypothetical protein